MPKVCSSSNHDSNVMIVDECNYNREELIATLDSDLQNMTANGGKFTMRSLILLKKIKVECSLFMDLVAQEKLLSGDYYMQQSDLEVILFLTLHQVGLHLYCYQVDELSIQGLGYL